MTEKEFRDKYYGRVKEQTIETLPKFIEEMAAESHDYGSICCAVAAGALAGAWATEHTPHGGITGFQAGAVMWEFIQQWNYSSNKCGLSIVDYDHLLYPQYSDKFEKTITAEQWIQVQKLADENLDKDSGVGAVRSHWQSIIDGKIPFGFTIREG